MAEAIRVCLDQSGRSLVARGLCQRGADVLTAEQGGRCGLPDHEHMAFPAGQGRVKATLDADSFRLAAGAIQHAGIAYCHPSRHDAPQLLQVVPTVDGVINQAEMRNRVECL